MSDELAVGEDYERRISFAAEIWRTEAGYVCVLDGYGEREGRGPTEDIAIAQAIITAGGRLLEIASREYTDKPQDGTRQIVGDEVSSEQLRDQYLGPDSSTGKET